MSVAPVCPVRDPDDADWKVISSTPLWVMQMRTGWARLPLGSRGERTHRQWNIVRLRGQDEHGPSASCVRIHPDRPRSLFPSQHATLSAEPDLHALTRRIEEHRIQILVAIEVHDRGGR